MRSRLFVLLGSLGLGVLVQGCALRNVKHDDCTSDDQCALTFGPGSACSEGFCSPPATCTTGQDCRKAAGGGACVDGVCVGTFPTDPACTMFTEPPDLLTIRADGADAPLVMGGIFSTAAAHDVDLTEAIRLAVREINRTGGLNNQQQLGIVFCDNGGPNDMADATARFALDDHATDYLAGTLGVPVILGPLTSSDAVEVITEEGKKNFATVVISPSATSPELTVKSPVGDPGLFWRTCPSDEEQGQVLATNVIGPNAAIKSVTVIYDHDPYGDGLSAIFIKDYTTGTTTPVPYLDTDITSPTQLANIATTANKAGGDAVLLIAVKGSNALAIIGAMAGMSIIDKPFFFTDGSMDPSLLDPTLPAWEKALLTGAVGTAPASPSGPNYTTFAADLNHEFMLDATGTSFLAQSYDAAYVGAYGVVWASLAGPSYDGHDVAKGLTHLESGAPINVGSLDWIAGKAALKSPGNLTIAGTSGPLHFNPTTGQAPGPIVTWTINSTLTAYVDGPSVQP